MTKTYKEVQRYYGKDTKFITNNQARAFNEFMPGDRVTNIVNRHGRLTTGIVFRDSKVPLSKVYLRRGKIVKELYVTNYHTLERACLGIGPDNHTTKYPYLVPATNLEPYLPSIETGILYNRVLGKNHPQYRSVLTLYGEELQLLKYLKGKVLYQDTSLCKIDIDLNKVETLPPNPRPSDMLGFYMGLCTQGFLSNGVYTIPNVGDELRLEDARALLGLEINGPYHVGNNYSITVQAPYSTYFPLLNRHKEEHINPSSSLWQVINVEDAGLSEGWSILEEDSPPHGFLLEDGIIG